MVVLVVVVIDVAMRIARVCWVRLLAPIGVMANESGGNTQRLVHSTVYGDGPLPAMPRVFKWY